MTWAIFTLAFLAIVAWYTFRLPPPPLVAAGLLLATPNTWAGPCLAQMAATSTRAAPTFSTELECELWAAVVQLEGELRTATIAAAAEEGIARLRLDATEIEPTPPQFEPHPLWWVLLGAVAVGTGTIGFLLGKGL